MSFYRVSLLDRQGVVVTSKTTDTLGGVAALLVGLGECSGEDWAKPYLDEYGEFTASIRRAGGAPLLDGEIQRVLELVAELGGRVPTSDEEIGLLRWSNPERRT